MTKVLFLDVDGVLNSLGTTNFKDLYPIDPYMAFLVGRIQLETGCDVVLSSSWRYHPEGMKHISERVVRLLDKTTTKYKWDGVIRHARGRDWPHELRGDEVNEWLSEHPEVTRHAILDDSGDFYDDQPLFQTTFQNGLTDEIAEKVIAYLNEKV